MIDAGKRNVLGVNVNIIDYDAAVERIVQAAKTQQGMAISALAVHGVMTGVLDDTHRYRLNEFDLICPDGQPVRWALNTMYKAKLRDRVYGPNLTLLTCERAAQEGLPIYLYGSRLEVLNAFTENLKARYPGLQIAGAQPSRFRQISTEEKQEIVEQIKASGAAIAFVGLGCPRQEVWAYEYRDQLSMPLLAVGAAFDFHAGLLPQAPKTMQNLGLEWLFRLIQEPQRLWKRYVLLNPHYVWLLSQQMLGFRKFSPATAQPPAQELRYG
ncbi:WecB/TagA/CpsF family glycosyltransferase [Lusitaniella coriacea LEGE 07157]|uniref:WecB/TagA/CpsF family glycosyltransferase n=1 Tax=Lusitaniella coriacea LEGE 07157 TaxID=945747 RepID=A0A8J7DX23_9CYAN|nr:WecB/TagA/CpsF family glycosyltransferase [Lusitaniella coriacea]MBE9116814.1 WecB/TagA/CpsF family glycosyltransferase [Lusitaniella coriacea LEGE 07157]